MKNVVNILYMDQHLIGCEKPVGIASEDGGLPKLLKEQVGGEIYCVHRLDRGVGGVIFYARTKQAAGKMSAMVAGHEVIKEYLAICEGTPEPEEGRMEDLLFHDVRKNKSYVVDRIRKGVKDASLEYETLNSDEEKSLVHITLHTGRSHQIRVQFASRKMPLAGDIRYGSKIRQPEIALWSYRMSFQHPLKRQTVTVMAPPPDTEVWNQLKTEDLIKKE